MTSRMFKLAALLSISLFSSYSALAQFVQQGPKLVGTGIGASAFGADQGFSVAISSDGNTAIVGGPTDGTNAGAVWVYTRSGGVWTQQGSKLVGAGAVSIAEQGISVALSSDGNTAIVGGPTDNANAGAAWVFTRSGGVWSQQGSKLVGTGAIGKANQGASVALSSDGNTAIIGGNNDNAPAPSGAAWVFTRSGGVWTEQSKLLGTGAVGGSAQGQSVALSSDGNTAIVGGINDNGATGAAWVFTRSGGIWTQQGGKLTGTGAVGTSQQGYSVSLSSDGNTALVGGRGDNAAAGAAWVYTRSGAVWTQQGNKLVGTGAVGVGFQGSSVSLSSDGNTAIVGGRGDNSNVGATWVYTRSGGIWSQQGSKLVGTGATGNASQGTSVSLSSDANTAIVGGYTDNVNIGAAWIFAALQPDLTIAKGHSGTFTQGLPTAYILTVSNPGAAATSGTITVSDTLPPALTFAGGGGAGFTCNAIGQVVTCTNPATPIPATGTAVINLNVNVLPTASGIVSNTASVACTCSESDTTNNASNTDTATIQVNTALPATTPFILLMLAFTLILVGIQARE